MARKSQPADPWRAASWGGAAEVTLLSGAQLTLAERLAWLEEAGRVARWLERRGAGDRRPTAGAPRFPGK